MLFEQEIKRRKKKRLQHWCLALSSIRSLHKTGLFEYGAGSDSESTEEEGKKRRLRRDLIPMLQYLKGGYKGDGDSI